MATVSELITELREDYLEDEDSQAYKWSDSKLLRYINEAIREACRSPLFRSTQTISIVAGTPTYTLDEDTLDIEDVSLALQTEPLTQKPYDYLSFAFGPGWKQTDDTPYIYVVKDLELTLYPNPIVNDTMTVSSFKYPEKLVSVNETPEIPELYHQSLCYWAAYKAYLTPDIDGGDLTRAQQYLSMFDQAFGIKRSARYNAIQMNNPKYNTVQPVRMC